MSRIFTGDRLVLATHNRGKIDEFRAMFRPRGIRVLSALDLGLEEPEETGLTFAANARLKAVATMRAGGLPALADDSGMAALGLDGAPGIRSARWAGPERDFSKAMRRVRDELLARFGDWAAAEHRASFVCALCLVWPDGHEELVEERVAGTLVPEPLGSHGFGYDAIFIPEGESRTFGQMLPAEKYALSHRRRAIDTLARRSFPGLVRPGE
jgi:XTP/dITP diphosphohydrolase